MTAGQAVAAATPARSSWCRPGLHVEVVHACQDLGVLAVPGVGTATEYMAARRLGLDVLKVFPAEPLGGPAFVRALASLDPACASCRPAGIDRDRAAATSPCRRWSRSAGAGWRRWRTWPPRTGLPSGRPPPPAARWDASRSTDERPLRRAGLAGHPAGRDQPAPTARASLDVDVYEVRLGDDFLMSSLFVVAEQALAELALADVDVPPQAGLDVLVGGLGLGYTARAVLADRRVRSCTSSRRSRWSSPGRSGACCRSRRC
jgi:hypothetical protein